MAAMVALFAGVIASLLRTVALLNCYSTESGYFDKGNGGALVTAMWAVAVSGVVFCAVICYMRRARIKEFERVVGMKYMVGAVILVFALLIVFFHEMTSVFGDMSGTAINGVCAAFALVSAVAVLTNAFIPAKGVKYTRAIFGLSTAVVCVLLAFEVYFTRDLVMNSPNKSVFILTIISAAMLVVFECRCSTEQRSPAVYTSLCLATLNLGLFSGVPGLIWWTLHRSDLTVSVAMDMICIAFAVYAIAGLYSMHHKLR